MFIINNRIKIIILFILLTLPCILFGEAQEILENSYKVDAGTVLDVINLNGSVLINSWDENNIIVTVKKTTWSWEGSKELKKVTIDVHENKEKKITTIETNYSIDEEKVYVYLQIKVPKYIKLNSIICNNGKVSIEKVDGNFSVALNNGSIEISNTNGNIDAKNSNGDIILQNIIGSCKLFSSTGKIKLKNITGNILGDLKNVKIDSLNTSGNINIKINQGDAFLQKTNGSINIEVINGSINIDDVNGDTDCLISSGSIKLNNINGKLKSKTENGKIIAQNIKEIINCITINGDITAEIKKIPIEGTVFSTENGDIRIDLLNAINTELDISNPRGNILLNEDIFSKIIDKGYNKFYGIIGTGGSKLSVSTKNGTIILHKKP